MPQVYAIKRTNGNNQSMSRDKLIDRMIDFQVER
jgi:hypothetical protein